MAHSQSRNDILTATVSKIEKLNPETVCVQLSCPEIVHYKAGQYLRIFIEGHTARSYSLASAPSVDKTLHLHVRRSAGGAVSRWFHEELAVGDALHISRPQGYCYYQPANLDRPMLMIGTGSGLAPLYGMARDALRHGHRGDIHLYHGVRQREELFLVEQLQALARLNPNFRYVPCLSRGDVSEGCLSGRALNIALRDTNLSAEWCVYLSGNPDMVNDAYQAVSAAGVAAAAILSDQLAVNAGTDFYARVA
ncbi:MAG TPA: FAD-binding oxidoreductase [Novimethylophilus sp.]|jgi:ferredoxin-NADP reductase|uniref:FAD-binding oxidoreductase n=1 Tax=Novimethylophilus sp. TaxID=2137426 RepID=UPI002F3EA557